MLWFIVVVVSCALLWYTLYCRYSYYGRQIAKIPGPWGLPLLGHGIDMMNLDPESTFLYLRNMNKTYGTIYKLYSLHIVGVSISDAEYVEKVLSTSRFNEKQVPYTFLKGWLCEGLLVSNGEKWKQRRKLLTPSFHFTILKGFCKIFDEHIHRFLDTLDKEVDKHCTDVVPIIARTTLNVMCETSLGTSLNHKDGESIINSYFKAITVYGSIIQRRIVTVYLHFDWIYKILPVSRTAKKLVTDLHELTNNVIQNRRILRKHKEFENNATSEDAFNQKHRLAMLDLLLELEKNGQIDKDGIREEVDTFMFEGHDTTATALSFMIMRIANETKVQERIYEELKGIFRGSDRSPTTEDLNNMKYLECCIKESLRLYPSVALIARYINEDVDFGKYKVPKGTIVYIQVFDIHRNPKYFPDPERFDPDRFLPENVVKRNPYTYIPFSAGPRNCIGQKFAMLEMKTFMSGLLRRFRLEPVTRPEDITFLADLVLRSKNPLYVRFTKRNP